MDDARCLHFFRQPTESLHRRYEVLRAFFLDRQPVRDIAEQFGFTPASVYSLVRDFRSHARAGQIPPFSSSRRAGGRPATTTLLFPPGLKSPPSPMPVA